MSPDDVAKYLQENPQFFEQYAPMIGDILIPHPHGGRAIPISERQILTLREKNRLLEDKLKELIAFGEENDVISEKLHRITLAMLAARDMDAFLHALYFNLAEDFAVPHVALRFWGKVPEQSYQVEFTAASQELRDYTGTLVTPYCGAHPAFEVPSWFGEAAENLRSYALVALRGEQTFGLLAMASEDPQRFYPEMGTLYLNRLGDLAGTILRRHLPLE